MNTCNDELQSDPGANLHPKRIQTAGCRMRRITRAIGLAVMAHSGAVASSDYTIQQLGPLPGGTSSAGHLLADDGATAVIESYGHADGATRSAVWTAAGGLVDLTPSGYTSSDAVQLSADGSMIAGSACTGTECGVFVWTPTSGSQVFPHLPGHTTSHLLGLSSPRVSVVVGRSCPASPLHNQCDAFVWTPERGMRAVPVAPGKSVANFAFVSPDGTLLLGSSCNRSGDILVDCTAVRIDLASDVVHVLGALPGHLASNPRAISEDNSVVSGTSCSQALEFMGPTSNCEAWVWTESGGLQGLGFLPGDTNSGVDPQVQGMAASGAIILGTSWSDPYSTHRFSWTPGGGMQPMPLNPQTDAVLWVAPDGGAVAGRSVINGIWQAVAWRAPDWQIELLVPGSSIASSFTGANGNTVIGQLDATPPLQVGDFDTEGFRWTSTLGFEPLGLLPGLGFTWPLVVTESGSSILGYQCDYMICVAFVWKEGSGLHRLDPSSGYAISEAWALSADGDTVLGASYNDGGPPQAVLWKKPPPNVIATSPGTDVVVNPVVTLPDGSTTSVQLTFDSVASGGSTTVTASSEAAAGAPESPSGFKVGDPPQYYEVSTSAIFSGEATLCFNWQEGQFENEPDVALFHYENGIWANITTTIDTTLNQVCGRASGFSPFAIFESAYQFSGFFRPVDNPPTRNVTKAGSAIPVKFSLNGDFGLSIFASGSPQSQASECSGNTPLDTVTETVNAGSSTLSYDAAVDQYTYTWKTNKAWEKSCRRLVLRFRDGSSYTADFEFRR